MKFLPLTVEDIARVRPFFGKSAFRTCDFTVGGMFMWRHYYGMEYAIEDGVFYSRIRAEDGRLSYTLPLSDDLPAAAAALVRSSEVPVSFCTVPEDALPILESAGTVLSAAEEEGHADYLYRAGDLAELKGKKYSGQRNQIHQFLRNVGTWSFDDITEGELEAVCSFFLSRYLPQAGGEGFEREENEKTLEVLRNYRAYGMQGGILRANGEIVGFSLNETVGDTLFTHIEKADRACKGAYQMLVNRSAERFVGGNVVYINREEDMGDEGLKTAKEAYHPVAMLKKYTVEVKG